MAFNFGSVLGFLEASRKALVTAVGVAVTVVGIAGGLVPVLTVLGVPVGVVVTVSSIVGVAAAIITPIATWLIPNTKPKAA